MIESIEIPTAILGFSTMSSRNKYFRFRWPIAISGWRSLSQLFGGTFFELVMVENPRNCRWNFDSIYHSSREISTSGLGGHIAISGCRSFSQSLSLNSPWSKPPMVQLETNTFVVLRYLNSWGLFLPPSATRVRKN